MRGEEEVDVMITDADAAAADDGGVDDDGRVGRVAVKVTASNWRLILFSVFICAVKWANFLAMEYLQL